MSLVITKDLRGFRIRESTTMLEGVGFVMDDGQTFSFERSWPATMFNLDIAMHVAITKQEDKLRMMRKVEDCFDFDADPIEVYKKLKEKGCTLDEECRIRMLSGPPLTEIHVDHIMPLIASHIENCEEQKKDPSVEPLKYGWIETEPGNGQIVFPYRDKLAAGKMAGGRLSLWNNRQVILSFQDWHMIPKGYGTGVLVQFLKCEPTDAQSVKELCGKTKAVVEDGVLITIGLRKLVFADISIDAFL